MRRPPAWVVVVGVVAAGAASPAPARAADGFWVTVAAGAAGAADPADYSEFWFDSPHAPPVAVTRFTGGTTAQAVTAGGSTFFTSGGVPVLLPTADGYATISNPDVPAGAGGLPRFAGGTQASGAPQSAPAPDDSARLAVDLAEKAADGSQALTVGAADPTGAALGEGMVTVPDGGWWVIGLGPAKGDGMPRPDPGPLPVDIGGGNGSTDGGGVIVTPVPVPVASPGGGAVTTPEPGTAVLLGLGGLAAAGWRRLRRR
ncbi:MAG: hypothetical protein C0501_17250 [Isosphaera sp.]|nr:hypothetical protein [Isosphaera sp.]